MAGLLELQARRIRRATEAADLRCRHCGQELTARRRAFCSDRCRSRAYRRRQAGLPEAIYPAGASRGRLALDELTVEQRVGRMRLMGLCP